MWERNSSTNHVEVVTLLDVNGPDNLPFRFQLLLQNIQLCSSSKRISFVRKQILRTTIGFSRDDFVEFSESRQNPKMRPKVPDTFPAVVINNAFPLLPVSW